MKKVIVFGNQQIAIECIEILRDTKDVNLLAVVGCERKRDDALGYPSLKKFCQKNNINYYNPEKLNDKFLQIVRRLKPDICFSIYYRNIFSPDYISIPPMGFINIHPGLLPKYRGSVPTLWALLNNEEEIGSTIHYIDQGIDSGDIIAQVKYKIPKNITGFKLNNIMAKKGTDLFKKNLPLILEGKNKRFKQDKSLATYYGPFNQNLKKINWSLPIIKIKRQVQAFTKPYAGARSFILGEELIIWEVEILKKYKNTSETGRIVEVRNNGIVVSGVDGFLLIKDFELVNSQNIKKYITIGNILVSGL